jgi:hypothetical protein
MEILKKLFKRLQTNASHELKQHDENSQTSQETQSRKSDIQIIYADIASAKNPEMIEKEFRCPYCGEFVSNTTPRFAIYIHKSCGTKARIEEYEVIRFEKVE